MNFLHFLVYSVVMCIIDVAMNIWCEYREMRKCKFECEHCKNWRCHFKYCQKQKAKLKEGE